MEIIVKKFHDMTVDELYQLIKLRTDVFVVEQNCVYSDLDNRDQEAIHVYMEDEGRIVACLRIMDRGVASEYVTIGRVVSAIRRQGIATSLLLKGIQVARERFSADQIYLEAQVYARSLYEKVGFRQISEEFLEDGIPHIKMLLQ